VGLRGGCAIATANGTAAGSHVRHVLGMRLQLQVPWVAAGWVIADMRNVQPDRRFNANGQRPSRARRDPRLALGGEKPPVSLVVPAEFPGPAVVNTADLNARPENNRLFKQFRYVTRMTPYS